METENGVACSRCGSENVTTEKHSYFSGVSHSGVNEILWVEIATCKDCGLREDI
jgi:transcription elongation factor Elf1